MAKSDAERQRERRARLKAADQNPILVRGKNGEFDERIRIALAVKELSRENKLPDEIIELIAKQAETVFPTPEPVTRKYINKLIKKFLKVHNHE